MTVKQHNYQTQIERSESRKSFESDQHAEKTYLGNKAINYCQRKNAKHIFAELRTLITLVIPA